MLRRLASFWDAFKRELDFWRRVWRHPNTPRLARWLLGFALVYAVSPIDIVPDFIPFLGQLDELVVIPVLVLLARRLVPRAVIAECREKAEAIPI